MAGRQSREEIQEQKVKERERDGEAEQGSAETIKGSGSVSNTMLVHRHLFISDIRKHQCTGCSAGSAGLQRTSPGPAIGLLLGSLAPVHCPPHRRLVPSLQSQKQRSENNNQARTGGIPLNSNKND